MFSFFLRSQPPKLPQRPLLLPHVVAAHERRLSTLLMQSMTHKAIYAQTAEGHTPAWTHFDPPQKRPWASFLSSVRALMQRALSALRARHTRDEGEDLVRRALEENGSRRVRFVEPSQPAWVYDQNEPIRPGISPRHEQIAELSPGSAVSAGWTVAARDAHGRMV